MWLRFVDGVSRNLHDGVPRVEACFRDEITMSNTRKVVISRTVLLFALVVSAALFSVAVYEDRSNGTLLDGQGIIDRETF